MYHLKSQTFQEFDNSTDIQTSWQRHQQEGVGSGDKKSVDATTGKFMLEIVDNWLHSNPHPSIYPLDHKNPALPASTLKLFVVFTDLICWIMEESQRLMKETMYGKIGFYIIAHCH